MATFQQKLSISLGSAALFSILALPQTYKVSNKLTNLVNVQTIENACPLMMGNILHICAFFIISFLTMGKSADTETKLRHSLSGSIVFAILTHPGVYATVAEFLGMSTANSNGCPTVLGVLLHAAVYTAILVILMYV